MGGGGVGGKDAIQVTGNRQNRPAGPLEQDTREKKVIREIERKERCKIEMKESWTWKGQKDAG